MLCPIGHNKLRLCLKRGVIKTVVSWEFRRVSWRVLGIPPGVLGIRRFSGDATTGFLVTSECTSAKVLL